MAKNFKDLREREIVALAIALEGGGRLHGGSVLPLTRDGHEAPTAGDVAGMPTRR